MLFFFITTVQHNNLLKFIVTIYFSIIILISILIISHQQQRQSNVLTPKVFFKSQRSITLYLGVLVHSLLKGFASSFQSSAFTYWRNFHWQSRIIMKKFRHFVPPSKSNYELSFHDYVKIESFNYDSPKD